MYSSVATPLTRAYSFADGPPVLARACSFAEYQDRVSNARLCTLKGAPVAAQVVVDEICEFDATATAYRIVQFPTPTLVDISANAQTQARCGHRDVGVGTKDDTAETDAVMQLWQAIQTRVAPNHKYASTGKIMQLVLDALTRIDELTLELDQWRQCGESVRDVCAELSAYRQLLGAGGDRATTLRVARAQLTEWRQFDAMRRRVHPPTLEGLHALVDIGARASFSREWARCQQLRDDLLCDSIESMCDEILAWRQVSKAVAATQTSVSIAVAEVQTEAAVSIVQTAPTAPVDDVVESEVAVSAPTRAQIKRARKKEAKRGRVDGESAAAASDAATNAATNAVSDIVVDAVVTRMAEALDTSVPLAALYMAAMHTKQTTSTTTSLETLLRERLSEDFVCSSQNLYYSAASDGTMCVNVLGSNLLNMLDVRTAVMQQAKAPIQNTYEDRGIFNLPSNSWIRTPLFDVRMQQLLRHQWAVQQNNARGVIAVLYAGLDWREEDDAYLFVSGEEYRIYFDILCQTLAMFSRTYHENFLDSATHQYMLIVSINQRPTWNDRWNFHALVARVVPVIADLLCYLYDHVFQIDPLLEHDVPATRNKLFARWHFSSTEFDTLANSIRHIVLLLLQLWENYVAPVHAECEHDVFLPNIIAAIYSWETLHNAMFNSNIAWTWAQVLDALHHWLDQVVRVFRLVNDMLTAS